MLYNGIELPDAWPPNYDGRNFKDFQNGPALRWHAPMPVPYLAQPPAVIPIDVGRQLFVDDFLIENSQLKRVWHQAEYHPASPLLEPDQPWEQAAAHASANVGPRAMPFSDGVWYDPKDGLFKLWYNSINTCYAVSRDGVRWTRPDLDVVPGTNIVVPHKRTGSDSSTVWLDHNEPDPAKRFKMWTVRPARAPGLPGNNTAYELRFSGDGIHWTDPVWSSGVIRDRSTVFYNPFRDVWAYSIKLRPTVVPPGDRSRPYVRSRAYREARDVLAPWREEEIVPWFGADKRDLNRNSTIGRQVLDGQHLYHLDAVAYESVMLGLPAIFHDDGTGPEGHRHMNDTAIAFSRDGFHWDRSNREPFLPVGTQRSDWNWTNVQSAGGGCLVVGDRLYFYCSGRTTREGGFEEGHTGLATLRRDGFASMDAGDREGELITRPVTFSGQHLFVNADTAGGELRVSIMQEDLSDFHDRAPKTTGVFTAENCEPIRTDSTIQRVTWKGAKDLSELSGKTVRFKFHLKRGSLYSFWVSPDESGASHGYVAAGGPGFPADKDTVGAAAYQAATEVVDRDAFRPSVREQARGLPRSARPNGRAVSPASRLRLMAAAAGESF